MKIAPLPNNETARLAALKSYEVLDTEAERDFDDLTALASQICGTPIALVSLVDGHRQWFKSKFGIEATETPRDIAFCAHTILGDQTMVVPDATKDERFFDNPLVVDGPLIRFYAGQSLRTPEGHQIGTLCVIDTIPRDLSVQQTRALQALGRQVVSQLELRSKIHKLRDQNQQLEELKRLAENASKNLAQSNQDLQQFAYATSHDLKAPLRAISSYASFLQEDYQSKLGAEADTWINRIVDNCRLMQKLIDDILAYSGIDSRAQPFSVIDFGAVFASAIAYSHAEIESTGGRVTCGDLPVVVGDPAQLCHLLQNLISNGLKYHREAPPSVHVSAEHRDTEDGIGEWVFAVADNGIGIEAIYHDQVFDIFRRLHTQDEFQGTGIGLAICRRITQRHQGKIWVESALGKGATFFFTLPGPRNPTS